MAHAPEANDLLAPLDGLLPALEKLYTDLHAHPELSLQETRTAGLAADGHPDERGPLVGPRPWRPR